VEGAEEKQKQRSSQAFGGQSQVGQFQGYRRGDCPAGEPLGIKCDPKRPWPQCPPQSFCYATSSVDSGPYCCCPVWSTIGAAWRPVGPSYPYYPPMPDNWPQAVKANANWGGQTSQYSGYIGQFGALLELLQHRLAKQRQQQFGFVSSDKIDASQLLIMK